MNSPRRRAELFVDPALDPRQRRVAVGGERTMLMEYARHNGHADLLRERIDGAVGM